MTTLTIGPGQQFATIAAAVAASRDGDVLAVQAGTYVNDFASISTDITIRGVGGMATVLATAQPPNGKAIFVTNGDITLDHIELVGASVPDRNGAGVRFEGGSLTFESSHVHHNENGVMSGAVGGTITIRNSEFAFNGAGDGFSHNIYAGHIARLLVDDSFIHDAAVGHQIKSRAEETVVIDSRIFDGGGTGSYSIDVPNGGRVVLVGNVMQQGGASQNPAIVHLGGEGWLHPGTSLEIAGSVVTNDLASGGSRLLLNHSGVAASIHDVQTWGLTGGQIASGPANVSGITPLAAPPALDLSSPWTASVTLPPPPAPAPIPVPVPQPLPPPEQPAPMPQPEPAPPPADSGFAYLPPPDWQQHLLDYSGADAFIAAVMATTFDWWGG